MAQAAVQSSATKGAVTPMMAQYLEIKARHADYLLFYRMGDFYELFFDDAVIASKTLDIVLTTRGKHEGGEIPMCGVPWHQAEAYLEKLIKAGHNVAVCEQMESPAEAKKRGGHKAVVKREVGRLVTPGTLTEDSLLDHRHHNYLAAIAGVQGSIGLAWVDISTGEFQGQTTKIESLPTALSRLNPKEILIAENLLQAPHMRETLSDWAAALKTQPSSFFQSQNAEKRLAALFEVGTLDALGAFSRAEISAAGALVNYIELTQKGKLPLLSRLKHLNAGDVLEIDPATLRNLEILTTLEGKKSGGLLATIDRTATAPGGRLLASWLAAPLTNVAAIKTRQNVVATFQQKRGFLKSVREILATCPDMERALSRLTLARGSPRDLAAIRDGLHTTNRLKDLYRASKPDGKELKKLMAGLGAHSDLLDVLKSALMPELPLLARDGNFIHKGFSAQLDEFRRLRDESKKLMAELQQQYVRISGVPTLKIRHNNVLGFFAEVTPKNADKMGEPFMHRQTLANAVRFTTPELANLEAKLNQADERALAIELQIFEDLVARITARGQKIMKAAQTIAQLDVLGGFAHLALEKNYCRPVVEDSLAFDIVQGRHAVVEAALDQQNEKFIANDAHLSDPQRLWLLTGPNMAGKSTYLRQNALVVILAQTGACVPAETATIGIVDKLFSRVGAADDLARGRSTFMVEMIETATILNQATEKSLVILDEIGRGTATFDGLSIAWACLEHLHDANKCRGLFATHYHELASLAAKLDQLTCHTMKVKEWQDSIVFLHEVIPGQADGSYGIHVARLAGLPETVTKRAAQVLQLLEKNEQANVASKLSNDLPLFQVQDPAPSFNQAPNPALEKLEATNPDDLTPRAALDLLYELKGVV